MIAAVDAIGRVEQALIGAVLQNNEILDTLAVSAADMTTFHARVVLEACAKVRAAGQFSARRADQEKQWMRALVSEGLAERFARHPDVATRRAELEQRVAAGELPATVAAVELLDLFGRDSG